MNDIVGRNVAGLGGRLLGARQTFSAAFARDLAEESDSSLGGRLAYRKVLALTDRTESTKCETKLSREEGALAHAQVTAAAPSRNSRLRGNRMGDLAARIRRRQAV